MVEKTEKGTQIVSLYKYPEFAANVPEEGKRHSWALDF